MGVDAELDRYNSNTDDSVGLLAATRTVLPTVCPTG